MTGAFSEVIRANGTYSEIFRRWQWLVHGSDGTDENNNNFGQTSVVKLEEGKVSKSGVVEEANLNVHPLEDILGLQ